MTWTERQQSKNVAVVCPLEYQSGLKDWIKYRESQGFVIHLITEPEPKNRHDEFDSNIQYPTTTPKKIRQKIRELNQRVPISTLILIGDGFPTLEAQFGWRDIVPAARVPSKVIQYFGEEDHIASDSWFADLDDDGFPDIPVGRLPVQSNQELIQLTKRIIDYETKLPSGNWQRRINLIAGVGDFSPVVDNIIDITVRNLFAELLPDDFELTLTQANWKSAYCPNPIDFHQTTLKRINEGSLFWIYLGHGFHQGLDRLQTPEGYSKILEFDDLKSIHCQYPPILLFCACYTGAFDAYEDSLAERIMIGENAPIAVLASSRTAMPYGMTVFGAEMLQELSQRKKDCLMKKDDLEDFCLGNLVFAAKHKMVQKIIHASVNSDRKKFLKNDSLSEIDYQSKIIEENFSKDNEYQNNLQTGQTERLLEDSSADLLSDSKSKRSTFNNGKTIIQKIDDIAKIFDPYPNQLSHQLEDHLHLFNLFGDPLLKIRFPQMISVETPEITYSAHSIDVSGEIVASENIEDIAANHALTAKIELVLPRNRLPIKKPKRKTLQLTSEEIRQFHTVYEAANQPVIQATETSVFRGKFSTKFNIPEDIFGQYIIRIYIQSQHDIFVGSRKITIRPFDTTAVRPSAYYEELK